MLIVKLDLKNFVILLLDNTFDTYDKNGIK
jgi:hypothetical protein